MCGFRWCPIIRPLGFRNIEKLNVTENGALDIYKSVRELPYLDAENSDLVLTVDVNASGWRSRSIISHPVLIVTQGSRTPSLGKDYRAWTSNTCPSFH